MHRGPVVVLSLTACVQRGPFQCHADEQCVWQGQQGTCEPSEFCSFPDMGCPSGRRYGDLAGGFSGDCVALTGDGGGTGPDAFTAVVPSNGVDPTLVIGAEGDLEVLDGENWVIDTDTGAIVRCGGMAVRAAGEGLIDGVRLQKLASPPEGAPVAVFAFDSLTIETSGQLYAVGRHALVLLVRDAVSVAGVLDVSGGDRACNVEATCGLSAGSRSCGGPGGFVGGVGAAGQGPGGGFADPTDLYGGGGGGFAGRGGPAGGAMEAAPGGGVSYGQARLVPLIGGSGGGGSTSLPIGGVGGGGGGGALQITSLGMIEISSAGRVAATGMGGAQGAFGGGGGGGAGGAILLEAPSLAISGRLSTNGGGGGGAGDGSMAGTAGTFGPNPAPGGAGPYKGGPGGARIAPDGQPGEPATDAFATAGGGGGAGRIVLRGQLVGPTGDISPDALLLDDLYVVP